MMTLVEQILLWVSVFCYLVSSIYYGYWFIVQKNKGEFLEKLIIYGGLACNIAAIALRTVNTGYAPIRIEYESNLFIVAMLVAIFLIWRTRSSAAVPVGMVALPIAVIILVGGYMTVPETRPLGPDYFSRWMVLHIVFSVFAMVCLVFATGSSILYLLKSRYTSANEPTSFSKLPNLQELSHISFRMVLTGFFCWTIMLVTGMLWAKDFWGNYWSWDPLETWSLISWLTLGVYLHFRLTLGWTGKKLAWLCIFSVLISAISMWGVDLVAPESYHNFQELSNSMQK